MAAWFQGFGNAVTTLLKPAFSPLDTWLASIPMSWARGTAALFFAATAIWACTLKREYVFQGAPDTKRWRDLRLWAIVVLIPYVIIYLHF
jgi:Mn2+/Fe2+ NRAMP family transporter